MDSLEAKAASEDHITLALLAAVENDSAITQRVIAGDLGIALGLANAYLKRCIKKGFVKVAQAPRNRYAYYLTPQGFAEKGRLTAEYLQQSFRFFRNARTECHILLKQCVTEGWMTVALVGEGDLAEVALLCAGGTPLRVLGPMTADHIGAGVDAVLITDLRTPQASFNHALLLLSPERVLAPPLLKISRVAPTFLE